MVADGDEDESTLKVRCESVKKFMKRDWAKGDSAESPRYCAEFTPVLDTKERQALWDNPDDHEDRIVICTTRAGMFKPGKHYYLEVEQVEEQDGK